MEIKELTELLNEERLDESNGYVFLAQAIIGLVRDGVLPKWAAYPVFFGTILGVAGLVYLGLDITTGGDGLKQAIKNLGEFGKKVKDRVTFSDKQIEEVKKSAKVFIDATEKKGKKNYMKSLLNKYSKMTKAKDMVDMKQEIDWYIEKSKD